MKNFNQDVMNPITEDDIANYLSNTPDFFERHAQRGFGQLRELRQLFGGRRTFREDIALKIGDQACLTFAIRCGHRLKMLC